MNLQQTDIDGAYYDADRRGDPAALIWFVAYVGPKDYSVEEGEELDVRARSKRDAREVARAALERDYNEECVLKEVRLA